MIFLLLIELLQDLRIIYSLNKLNNISTKIYCLYLSLWTLNKFIGETMNFNLI